MMDARSRHSPSAKPAGRAGPTTDRRVGARGARTAPTLPSGLGRLAPPCRQRAQKAATAAASHA